MIEILKNPKTSLYDNFKNYVKSNRISYYYYESSTHPEDDNKWFSTEESKKNTHVNIPYYSHNIVERPDGPGNNKVPKISSDIFPITLQVCEEILNYNNIDYTYFLRMNINIVHPQRNVMKSIPHTDHDVYHKNLIVYFTESGGKTFVGNEFHDPKEDDIILFEKTLHFMETPEYDRRIILISTFV
jgi:hypothetical protein